VNLKEFIRDIPDFPKKGIIFKDITPLLLDSKAFEFSLDELYRGLKDKKISKVLGVESRGFIFAASLAAKFNLGFIPVRKPGKLPYETIREEYSLEYGTDALEIHKDAINAGDRIWLVDDLLATGGTAEAAVRLVKKLSGEVAQVSFLIELGFLNGKQKLSGLNVHSVMTL
jgi:adenine phosphoribosyltransferase